MKQDVTLKDYIERKTENRGELGISKSMAKRLAVQNKLTFEEWYMKERPYSLNLHQVEEARLIWKAAQENV